MRQPYGTTIPHSILGTCCCGSSRRLMADIVAKVCGLGGSNFPRAVRVSPRKNMWGTTQTAGQATSGFSNRVTMELNGTFSLRRVSRRFLCPPNFRTFATISAQVRPPGRLRSRPLYGVKPPYHFRAGETAFDPTATLAVHRNGRDMLVPMGFRPHRLMFAALMIGHLSIGLLQRDPMPDRYSGTLLRRPDDARPATNLGRELIESPEDRYHPLQVQRTSAVKDLKPLAQ